MSLVLASASRARLAMLRAAGLDVEPRPSGVDEAALKASLLAEGCGPRAVADALAEAKAARVSLRAPGLVLGADQTLDFEGRLYDKPDTAAAARDRLLELRGRTHRLHSAAVLAVEGRPIWRAVQTVEIGLRTFSETFLDAYLAREGEAALETTGAYRLEDQGVQLMSRVEGDHFAVLGLPLLPLLEQLRRLGELPT